MRQIHLLIFLLVLGFHGLQDALAGPQFCVAHRGNSSEELENSRAAVISAARLGVKAVEFDIHHTFDGVAILNHDKTLERVTKEDPNCPRTEKISHLFYSQLESCRLKNGERIPLFKDIVQELKEYPIQLVVEYKSDPRLQDLVFLQEEFSENPERLMIISFNEASLDKLVFLRGAFDFLKDVKILLLKGIANKKISKFDGLDTRFLGRRHVKSLKRKGKLIGTYTKNSRKKIRKYFKRGVDFVTTNYPKRCMEELERLD